MKRLSLYATTLALSTFLFSCSSVNMNRISSASDMEVAASKPRAIETKNEAAAAAPSETVIAEVATIAAPVAPVVKSKAIEIINENTLKSNIQFETLTASTNDNYTKSIEIINENTLKSNIQFETLTASTKDNYTKSMLTSKAESKKLTIVERIKTRFSEKINRMLASAGASGKSQLVALLLAIFLGGLGIHRFYLGYIGIGVIQLLTGGLCIWALVDLIRIAMGSLKPKGGDYSEKLGGK